MFKQIKKTIQSLVKRDHVKRMEKNGHVYYKHKKKGEVFYEYEGEFYPGYLNKGNAAWFILEKAKKYCQGKGVDVGSDRWPFPGATPVKNEEHQNAYKLDNFQDGSLDYVFSSHCLEHLEKWRDALLLWIEKLKTDGTLFLYLPHRSMRFWNPGGAWVRDTHKWIPDCETITEFLKGSGMDIIEYNTEKDAYWSFHIIAKKTKQ